MLLMYSRSDSASSALSWITPLLNHQGLDIVTSRLVKNSFPLFFSFLSRYQTPPAQHARSETVCVCYLVLARCITPLYLRLFYRYLTQSRVCWLCWLALFGLNFVLRISLAGYRCSVRFHWFFTVTLRQVLLDLIRRAESLVFHWTTGQISFCFWLPIGWTVTEAHCQSAAGFVEQCCSFLGLAIICVTRCFLVLQCCAELGESHCESPTEVIQTKTRTLGRCNGFLSTFIKCILEVE